MRAVGRRNLLALYVLTTRWTPQRRSVGLLVVAGLVFAAAGDTALLLRGTVALLAGMALFLVTQVRYLLAWLILGAGPELRRRWWIALPCLAALAGLVAVFSAGCPTRCCWA